MTVQEWLSAITLLGSFVLGFLGVYIGMRIAIARLETWRDVLKDGLTTAQRDIAILADDCHTFDVEHELIMNKLALARVRRQRFRD